VSHITNVHQITLEGERGTYSFSDLSNGRHDLSIIHSFKPKKDPDANETVYSGTLLAYQQPYSVVTGITWMHGSGPEYKPDRTKLFKQDSTLGFVTAIPTLSTLTAQNATFNYTGVAFDSTNNIQEGTLDYTVNFGSREGQGSITGLASTGTIDLQAAQLDNRGVIRGDAHFADVLASAQQGKYELSFFGPDAEEIAGFIYDRTSTNFLGENHIIFAGQR